MSLPETCPFCGASPYVMADAKPCRGGDSWILFSCDTALHAGQDIRRTQSRKCEGLERTRLTDRLAALQAENKVLRDRVAELEARCKRLEKVGDMIVAEYMVVDPEKSAWKQAKEAKP